MTELADPGTSQAVLVGTAQYRHLTPLPAVSGNVAGLCDALTDAALWGLPAGNCRVALDVADPAAVARAVRQAAASVGTDGLLLVYYAGHGLIDPADGALILALPGCEPEVPHEAGLPYEWIRRATSSSGATRRIVILDCCYAGRASPEMAAQAATAAAVADRAEIEETCLLVSAPGHRPAAAPVGEPYTAFTGELLRLLRTGLPGGEPLLTMEVIYRQVRKRLLGTGYERPELRERNAGASIALVRNVATGRQDLTGGIVVAGPAATDPDLRQAAILILRHDSTGAMGVRLTGPASPLPDEFSPEWRRLVRDPPVVREGGPVARDGFIAVALLRPKATPPIRFVPVRNRLGVVALSTPPETLRHCVAGVWIYSGYLGWGPGELEAYLSGKALVCTDHPVTALLAPDPRELCWPRAGGHP